MGWWSCTVDNVPLDEISEGDGLITQADGITSIALPLDDVNDQIESEVDADVWQWVTWKGWKPCSNRSCQRSRLPWLSKRLER